LTGLPVSPAAVRRLLEEIEESTREARPLVVGGASELAPVLRRELLDSGGEPPAVREGSPDGAALYVHVLAGGETDEVELRRARRARVPIVVVAAGSAADRASVPFVAATDVVPVPPGAGFPIEGVARAIARRLGEDGAPLAARVPLLRPAVCDWLVGSFARRNGLVAAAVFVPGADLPVLTLKQLRLVLRLAQAHGLATGQERLPELAAVAGAGLGLRAAARELLDLVPVAGWVVKGAVAYAGTRTLGEAARRRFAAEAAGEPTPPPA
jgi:uncharacterized protein (DUF697 family)